MAENTRIEWADMTFNPWIGCTKVSPGCDHCYAEAHASRFGTAEWGAGRPRHLTSAANWHEPLKWAARAG
jgi:protein gp37